MKPVAPEHRCGYSQVVFAKDQPEYIPLPANFNGVEVETKWRLTWRERLSVLFRGSIYLSLLTFGKPLQPIRLSVLREPDDGDPGTIDQVRDLDAVKDVAAIGSSFTGDRRPPGPPDFPRPKHHRPVG